MHIGDLETDGLPSQCTKIWLNITYCLEENQYYFSFDKSSLEAFNIVQVKDYIRKNLCENFYVIDTLKKHFELLRKERVCYHNFFQFDRLVIRKLIDKDWEPETAEDTYILSQLYWPDRGLHGIEAWGEKFGIPKPKHEDWTKFSLDMVNRCFQDVRIGVKTWVELEKEEQDWISQGGSWKEAKKIEYGIAKLQGMQEFHGVKLDVEKAYSLADEIYMEIQKIDEELLEQMPPRIIKYPETVYEREPFKKDGTVKLQAEEWINGY